ncbi:hypothetical protein [Caudoviricetes sp.]|nr:hypothetical protein [Caudoviricetes sp.]
MDLKDGVSCFEYYLLEDSVCLNCRVVFDEYGEADIDEILLNGEVDVTDEILSFGLHDKIVDCQQCADNFEQNHDCGGDE